MTKKTDRDATHFFTYNAENRLAAYKKRAFEAGSWRETQAAYKYSVEGNRIEKSVDGQVRRYVYDGIHILYTLSGSDAVLSRFVHGDKTDEVLARVKPSTLSTVEYFHTDAQGSTTELSDEAGNRTSRYRYTAFGELRVNQAGGSDNQLLYAGREYDGESGLYYNRFRMYDAKTGRFTGKDSYPGDIMDPMSLHRYLYVMNNPMRFTDPFGLAANDEYEDDGSPAITGPGGAVDTGPGSGATSDYDPNYTPPSSISEEDMVKLDMQSELTAKYHDWHVVAKDNIGTKYSFQQYQADPDNNGWQNAIGKDVDRDYALYHSTTPSGNSDNEYTSPNTGGYGSGRSSAPEKKPQVPDYKPPDAAPPAGELEKRSEKIARRQAPDYPIREADIQQMSGSFSERKSTAKSAPQSQNENKYYQYKVKAGEGAWDIAKKHGVPFDEFLRINPKIRNRRNLGLFKDEYINLPDFVGLKKTKEKKEEIKGGIIYHIGLFFLNIFAPSYDDGISTLRYPNLTKDTKDDLAIWPVDTSGIENSIYITSRMGYRWIWKNGVKVLDLHPGVDMSVPGGEEIFNKNVRSMIKGFVTHYSEEAGAGRNVWIMGKFKGETYWIKYFHMNTVRNPYRSATSKNSVEINKGESPGTVGKTGFSIGAGIAATHLHIEVRKLINGRWQLQNPLDLLRQTAFYKDNRKRLGF